MWLYQRWKGAHNSACIPYKHDYKKKAAAVLPVACLVGCSADARRAERTPWTSLQWSSLRSAINTRVKFIQMCNSFSTCSKQITARKCIYGHEKKDTFWRTCTMLFDINWSLIESDHNWLNRTVVKNVFRAENLTIVDTFLYLFPWNEYHMSLLKSYNRTYGLLQCNSMCEHMNINMTYAAGVISISLRLT